MADRKTTLLINSPQNSVKEDLICILAEDGFKTTCFCDDKNIIDISASNKARLPKLLFQFKRPEIIRCILSPDVPYRTCLKISYEYSTMFMSLIYLILTVAASIIFYPIYKASEYPDADVTISICYPVAFIGYFLLMATMHRILINDHYRILLKTFKAKGHTAVVFEKVGLTKEKRNSIFFLFVLLSLFCLPLVMMKPQFTEIFYLTIGIGICAVWCALRVPIKVIRSPHFVVLFLCGIISVIYGILPVMALAPPVSMSSLVAFGVYVILVIIALVVLSKTMLMSLESVSIVRNNPEQIQYDEKWSIPLIFFVIAAWILLNAGFLISLVASLNFLEFCLLGSNYIFSNTADSTVNGIVQVLSPVMKTLRLDSLCLPMIKLFFIIYFSPVVIVVAYIFLMNMKQVFNFLNLLINRKYYPQKQFQNIQIMIEHIAQNGRIRKPFMRVSNSEYINAYCILPYIPFMRNIVLITTKACEVLSPMEMEALIAHEMGHLISKHSLVLSILNFFSRWTFLGEGFASMLTKNSKTMESEADKFAVLWLENNHKDGKTAMFELLKIQEKQRIKVNLTSHNRNTFHGLPAFENDRTVEYLIHESENYKSKQFFQKRIFDFRLFRFFIFHGWISTYLHVPYDERIKYINSLEIKAD